MFTKILTNAADPVRHAVRTTGHLGLVLLALHVSPSAQARTVRVTNGPMVQPP